MSGNGAITTSAATSPAVTALPSHSSPAVLRASPKRRLVDQLGPLYDDTDFGSTTSSMRSSSAGALGDSDEYSHSPKLHASGNDAPLRTLRQSLGSLYMAESPLRSMSPEKIVALEHELLGDRDNHFVELTTYPCATVRRQLAGGMTAVRNLLTANISLQLYNPTLAAGVTKTELFLAGPVGCGLRTAVINFCQEQKRSIAVLQYNAFRSETELSVAFWSKMYQLAQLNQPCILLVHRLQRRIPPVQQGQMLASMHAAHFRRSTSEHSKLSNVWTVFIEETLPQPNNDMWHFEAAQVASYCTPSREERFAALRTAIYNRLCHSCTLDQCDAQIRHYDPLISRCVEPISDTLEMELHGVGAIETFVTLLFGTSLARQPELMQQSCLLLDPQTMLPTERDFTVAMQRGQQRQLRIDNISTINTIAAASHRGGANAAAKTAPRRTHGDDAAMYYDGGASISM